MDTIFLSALQDLLSHGKFVEPICDVSSPHSGFGRSPRRTLEVCDWSIRTQDIRTRFLANSVRGARIDRAIGMTFWSFLARTDVVSLQAYNPRASDFSDDGRTIRAPWGYRILGDGRRSSVAQALSVLAQDRSSLRAVVPVLRSDDVGVPSRDVPCLQSLHFTYRSGSLHLTCFLRSLNPYWVWPYDHFFLTTLLEFCSRLLRVEPGSLGYLVSSLQIDETDIPSVELALNADAISLPAMAPMEAEVDWTLQESLTHVDAEVRSLITSPDVDPASFLDRIEGQDLPTWWKNVATLLALSFFKSTNDPRWHIIAKHTGNLAWYDGFIT
jgi:thymidylate synthase